MQDARCADEPQGQRRRECPRIARIFTNLLRREDDTRSQHAAHCVGTGREGATLRQASLPHVAPSRPTPDFVGGGVLPPWV